MKCYLHRTFHEWNSVYSLLENGLLSVGWSDFSNRDFLDGVRTNDIDFLNSDFSGMDI